MASVEAEHDLAQAEIRPERFESWRAFVSCFTLDMSACALMCGPAYYYSQHWVDWAFPFLFHTMMWVVPHLVVHRPKTPLNVAAFGACALVLAVQPHVGISRRVPFIGAIHGAASIVVLVRMVQFYANSDCDEYRSYKGFRRMFFISSWGWHDVSNHSVVFRGPGFFAAEALRFFKWLALLLSCVAFELAWGKRPSLNGRGLAVHFAGRWAAGFFMMLGWFNAMDAMVRAMHFWSTEHEVRSLCHDPWSARTLKEFWGRRWNLPIQELLTRGVYLPIVRAKWLPARKLVGKAMVFVVSGLGHTYAVSCGGEPWLHLVAMFSFFVIQLPLILIEDAFALQGAWWVRCPLVCARAHSPLYNTFTKKNSCFAPNSPSARCSSSPFSSLCICSSLSCVCLKHMYLLKISCRAYIIVSRLHRAAISVGGSHWGGARARTKERVRSVQSWRYT